MLSKKTRYLQVALNSTLDDAYRIISTLPASPRILIEAGTPLIKQFGVQGIAKIHQWWQNRLFSLRFNLPTTSPIKEFLTLSRLPPIATPNTQKLLTLLNQSSLDANSLNAYVVADLKAMDRGEREVLIAKEGGASAAVVLGLAPIETIDAFIENCEKYGLDAMIDMMNVTKPYQILRKLKKLPKVVILHRGVDEEKFSDKPLPIHMINKIKGAFDVMISIAGGDTPREIQSAVFNGADIVVLWKHFYRASVNTARLAEEFLREIK